VLKPLAEQAFNGEGQYICGEHCQFCRAAVKCRARDDEKLKLAKHEFKVPSLLADEEIEEILGKVDDLTSWAKAVKEYAFEQALAGKKWTGYKIVAGRSVRYSCQEVMTNDRQISEKLRGFSDCYRQTGGYGFCKRYSWRI
jgi:hypothetical protein